MLSVATRLVGSALTGDFKKAYEQAYGIITQAAMGGMHTAAANVQKLGFEDIMRSGYGYNWARDLVVTVYPKGGRRGPNPKAYVYHKAPNNFAGIPEFGLSVTSSKLMWIPFDKQGMVLSKRGTPQSLTIGRAWMNAAGLPKGENLDYVSPKWSGINSRVPLLVKKRKSNKERMQPVFFGVHHIDIPKSWHITEIAEAQADALPFYFETDFERLGGQFDA